MGKITWGLSPQTCQWIVKVQWEAKKVKKVKLLLVILAGGLIATLQEQKTAVFMGTYGDHMIDCPTLHDFAVPYSWKNIFDVRPVKSGANRVES